ncbi:MAG: hypothetical protein JWL89_402 [Candidatus Saccharibacteria bacterium]|nr:hypothetical protein [Candidatus Saccharibacteria bacterium]
MLQALNLSRLVSQEQDWLRQTRPETLQRYFDPSVRGKKNINRLAKSNEVQAFIVRKSIVAIGLATIVFDRTVIHPSLGSVEGDSLDYWLRRGMDEATHRVVAEKLIAASQQINEEQRGPDNGLSSEAAPRRIMHSMFAAVVQDVPNPSVGFAYHMDPMGEPASLKTELPSDRFDIAKGGALAQLYGLSNEQIYLPRFEAAAERD